MMSELRWMNNFRVYWEVFFASCIVSNLIHVAIWLDLFTLIWYFVKNFSDFQLEWTARFVTKEASFANATIFFMTLNQPVLKANKFQNIQNCRSSSSRPLNIVYFSKIQSGRFLGTANFDLNWLLVLYFYISRIYSTCTFRIYIVFHGLNLHVKRYLGPKSEKKLKFLKILSILQFLAASQTMKFRLNDPISLIFWSLPRVLPELRRWDSSLTQMLFEGNWKIQALILKHVSYTAWFSWTLIQLLV